MGDAGSSIDDYKSMLQAQREHLVDARQKAQEQFDKTVLTLSGGGLAISLAFVKDIVGANPAKSVEYLLAAWISWIVSCTFTLASFYGSRLSLTSAIRQVDAKLVGVTKHGRNWAIITDVLNVLGGLAFVVGVIAIVVFVSSNMFCRE